MKDSIFTKIIKGEIPCYKIYEDDTVLAFLDIMPNEKGHTLLVPKAQIDKLYDIDDELYSHLWMIAKKIAKHYEKTLGYRIMFQVVGIDVPHAHIHIIPRDPANHGDHSAKISNKQPANSDELTAIAKQLHLDD